MTRRVLLYPGEDGFVVAEVPSLPGCVSQGRTREEALDNVPATSGSGSVSNLMSDKLQFVAALRQAKACRTSN